MLFRSEMLKAIAEYAKHDRAEFVRVVQEAQSSQQTAEVKKQRTRLATAKQRVSELEVLLCKIYEDNILGKLSDSRYATLDAQYEKEQTELTAEISALEKAVKSYAPSPGRRAAGCVLAHGGHLWGVDRTEKF